MSRARGSLCSTENPVLLVLLTEGPGRDPVTANMPSRSRFLKSLEERPGPPMGTAQGGLGKPQQVSEHIKCLESQWGAGGGGLRTARQRENHGKQNHHPARAWTDRGMKTTSHSLTPSRWGGSKSRLKSGEENKESRVDCASPGGPWARRRRGDTPPRRTPAHQQRQGRGSSPGPATVRRLTSPHGRRPGPTYVLMRTHQAPPLKKPKTVHPDSESNPV